MSWEALTALATLGTFFVILMSAAAALKQLRHSNAANQVAALIELRESLESPRAVAARNFIMTELPKRLNDPAEARKLARAPSFWGEYDEVRYIGNILDTFGLLVKKKIVDKNFFYESFGYVVLSIWDALLPLTTCVRRASGLDFWGNFEYLAYLATRFNESSGGIKTYSPYPANLRRMPQDSSLYDLRETDNDASP